MFVFQVINDEGEIISQELCVKAIKKCFKDVARKEGGDGMETMIPVFTAGDRDTWAAVSVHSISTIVVVVVVNCWCCYS